VHFPSEEHPFVLPHFDLSHFDLSQALVVPDLQHGFVAELFSLVTTVVAVVLEVCAFTQTIDPKKIIVIEISITAKNCFFIFFIFFLLYINFSFYKSSQ
jgi:hypothetical protein